MDGSETYMNVNVTKTDSETRTRADPDVSYVEVNFRALPATRERTGRAAQEQDSKVKIRIRTYRLICLFCIVTSALILTVAGLSIHGIQRDLRHKYTELETKYRSVNETKAQICEFLTSRREQTCSKGWVRKTDRCYYASTSVTDYNKAMQECENRESRLLQIKESDEARFLSHSLLDGTRTYWIGKCETGDVGRRILYKVPSGTPACRQCGSRSSCKQHRRYICEKPAAVFPDVPVKIQGLCQQPVEATRIK